MSDDEQLPGEAGEDERWKSIWALERPSARALLRSFDSEAGVERVRQGIHHRTAVAPISRSTRSAWWATRIATVALAASVIGVLVLVLGHNLRPWSVATREYATQPGQRLTARLPDGTQMTLGPASTLRVPADYIHGDRTVRLEGEAYFAVVHEAAHPFAVRAGDVLTRDVGTAFDVRSYAGDTAVQIVVTEGTVAVGAGRDPPAVPPNTAMLHANDMATIANGQIAVTHAVNVATYTIWRQGGLAFEDTPLRDVVRDLSRTFDLQITLADTALGAKRITSTFTHEPVEQILDIVTQIVGARYQRVGHTIVIQPDHESINHPAAGHPAALSLTTARR